ncbi:MAG: XTP/dITP diphosphatase [Dissulfurispiraceae bacterium]
MEIVLATRNRQKIEEMRRILNNVNVTTLTLDDFPLCPDVVEDQDTFEGNAVKKATEIARYTGKMAMADDSGLQVDALGGAPGIRSARYAGEGATDAENITKLLAELRDLPDENRGAQFVCCIALAFPRGEVIEFRGSVKGKISENAHGRMGFGYDPVFYPSGYDKTFAEMSPQEKDALSHRSKAINKLKDYLKDLR